MMRCAVIGDPVAHSLSPRIHAAFAAQTGLALDYQALAVTPEALAERVASLFAEGWRGCNVTLPHKAAVAALCRARHPRAEQAGAVNTLIRGEDGWIGDNTDGLGFMADLARLGIAIHGRRVLVVGAGGAARGLLGPLLAASPAQLVVSNRNPWKPEALAEAFAPLGRVLPRTHLALKGDRYDLLINATSAGHDGSLPRLPPGLLAAGAVAYDLSYGAAHRPFADWARHNGASAVHDGLGMLVEQAAESFLRWHGQRPQTGPVLAALRAG